MRYTGALRKGQERQTDGGKSRFWYIDGGISCDIDISAMRREKQIAGEVRVYDVESQRKVSHRDIYRGSAY